MKGEKSVTEKPKSKLRQLLWFITGLATAITTWFASQYFFDVSLYAFAIKMFTYSGELLLVLLKWILHIPKQAAITFSTFFPKTSMYLYKFFWSFVWRIFFKPWWALLTIFFIALAGPRIMQWLQEKQKKLLKISIKARHAWQKIHLALQSLALMVVAYIVYILGYGILLPLIGFPLLLEGLRRLFLYITDGFVSNKTATIQERMYRIIRNVHILRMVHNRYVHHIKRNSALKGRALRERLTARRFKKRNVDTKDKS